MIIKSLITLVQIVAVILSACACSGGRNGNLDGSLNEMITISVTDHNNHNNLFLSDFISDVRIISLEFNENCPLREITKVVVADSSIFIIDGRNSKGIYRFDMNGKFICRIGQLGRGPGEHISLMDFSVNSERKSIYILCNGTKNVFEYSYNNELLQVIPVGHAADDMEYMDNRFYLFRENSPFQEFNLIIEDMKGKPIVGLFRSNRNQKSSAKWVFTKQQNHILMHTGNNDTIYKLKDESIEYAYNIDFGKQKINNMAHYAALMEHPYINNPDPMKYDKILQKYNYILGVKYFLMVNDIITFTYAYQNIVNTAFYDLRIDSTVTSISCMDDFTWFYYITPISQTNDCFVSVYYPSLIENNIKTINLNRETIIPENEADRAIEKLNFIRKSDIGKMNPIIMMYKIK